MKWVILILILFFMNGVLASEVICTIANDKVLVEIAGDEKIIDDDSFNLEKRDNGISFISKEFIKYDGE